MFRFLLLLFAISVVGFCVLVVLSYRRAPKRQFPGALTYKDLKTWDQRLRFRYLQEVGNRCLHPELRRRLKIANAYAGRRQTGRDFAEIHELRDHVFVEWIREGEVTASLKEFNPQELRQPSPAPAESASEHYLADVPVLETIRRKNKEAENQSD